MSTPSPAHGSPTPRAGRHRPIAGLLSLLALWLLAMVWLQPDRYLDLPSVQSGMAAWQAWREQAPLASALFFGAVYVVITGLSLPGALVLSLAAGALFGLGWGTLVVLVSATLGATVSMLLSRHLLRAWVAQRFGRQMKVLEQGLARDGALCLLSLRLLPVVPFFVLNLLMGLLPMRTWTYAWVSLVGMLPATLVVVNAGTALAQLQSLSDVFSRSLLLALALLAALPWVSRASLSGVRHWQQGRRWRAHKPARFERNLLVIGGGAGGLVTAYMAAALKARVTLVEAERLGGECLYTGCVPSKALIHAARTAELVRRAARVGVKSSAPEIDWPALVQRLQDVIRAIEPHDSPARYTALGVEVIQGRAKLLSPWTVELRTATGVRELSARAIVLATGAEPVRPDLPGLELLPHASSDALWTQLAALPQLPARMVLLGGGAMGCELAQAFARLGAQVTLVERGEQLLVREDPDVAQAALAALQLAGVQVHLQSQALRCEPQALFVQTPQGEVQLDCDFLVLALGRKPRLQGLGLEELGLDISQGLQVNAYMQTGLPSVYAVGDVAGPWQLTHAAAHQGWHAAFNALLGIKKLRADRALMPQTLFLDPEIARVGLNEREAQAQGQAYELTRFDLGGLDRALTDDQASGFIKLLTVPGSDRLLGVTIVGPQAGELLAEYALAMKHGLGLNQVLSSIHAYPTLAEANKAAAGAWKRAHQPAWALRWLERWHAWRRG